MLRREFLDGKMTERQAINADAKLLGDAYDCAYNAAVAVCRYRAYCDLGRNIRIDKLLWRLLRELYVICGGLTAARRTYTNKRAPMMPYEAVYEVFSPLAQKKCEEMMDWVSAMVKERESRKGGAE